MRKIKEIIIHCSATKEGRNYTVADIDRWHRERGFFCIGYHFVIYRDGSIHVGRSVEEVGAHARVTTPWASEYATSAGFPRMASRRIPEPPSRRRRWKPWLSSWRRNIPRLRFMDIMNSQPRLVPALMWRRNLASKNKRPVRSKSIGILKLLPLQGVCL